MFEHFLPQPPEKEVPRTCNATLFSLRKEESSGEPSGFLLSEVSQMENRYRRTPAAIKLQRETEWRLLQRGIYCRAKLPQG